MAITVDSPCDNGATANVIAFYSNPLDCSKRTNGAAADRITISGTGVNGRDTVVGIVIDAAPECDPVAQKVLGNLKANFVEFSGLEFGIISSLSGGAQVDIKDNQFSQVGLPVAIVDASQSTTVLRNQFNYNDVAGYASNGLGTTAVFIGSTSDSPSSNSTIIKDNTFVDGGESAESYAVLSGQDGKAISHGVSLLGNTFRGNAGSTSGIGIAILDTPSGLISTNEFIGTMGKWIELDSGGLDIPVSGWAISGNSFAAAQASVADISLGTGTSGNVIARGQDLPVVNDASGSNDVLESSATVNFFSSKPISIGAGSAYRRQMEFFNGTENRALGR